jgi:peroxiredoxin
MKKGFLFLLIIICCTTLSFAKKKKKKVETVTYVSETTYEDSSLIDARIGAKLIEINSLTSNDTFFTSKNIPANNNVILVLFNPGCGHCADVTKQLKNELNKIKNTTVVLITGNNLHSNLKEFMQGIELTEKEGIIVSSELGDVTKKIFLQKGIPQVMVYGKDKLLRKIFFKEINVEELISYLDK